AVALLLGCGKAKEKLDALSGGSEEKTYAITNARVLETNRANSTMTIMHEDIAGLTQRSNSNTYELRGQTIDSLDLSGSTVFVNATLHKRGRDLWLTDVTRSPGR